MSVTSVDNFRLEPDAAPHRLPRYAGDPAYKVRRAASARDSGARPPPVEIAFLLDYGVPIDTLRYATAVARRQGVSSDAALLAEGLVAEDVFYRALADHLGVRFLDQAIELAPGALASASQGYVPLREGEGGMRWLFAPSGAQLVRLMSVARTAKGRPLFAVTTRARFLAALRGAACPLEVARAASLSAERAEKELSVHGSLREAPLAHASAALLALVACLFIPAAPVSLFASLLLAAAFLSSVCLRLCACAASFAAPESADLGDEARLPVYTVIIPLYREAAVARQLVRAMDRLDYPRAKLDIKFVVEPDDDETAAALRAYPPRAPYEIVVAPEGGPRTKPRALNVAMPFARGSLVVVFDAEDIPDSRQLRRAAALFAVAPKNVACLQASLVIDNCALNWMTGMFALDYAALFDVHNKGLAAQSRAMVFLPIWLAMLSLACWRAFFELWRKPFHWEKTAHGLTTRGDVDLSGEEPLLESEAGA